MLVGTRVPLDIANLDGACLSSFKFSSGRTSAGCSSERLAGCAQVWYVLNTSALSIVKYDQNVEFWLGDVFMWSMAMIFFISLRISKRAPKVVWKVGAKKKDSKQAAGVVTIGQ